MDDDELLKHWLAFGVMVRPRLAVLAAEQFKATENEALRGTLLAQVLHQYALCFDDLATWSDAIRNWRRQKTLSLAEAVDGAKAENSWSLLRLLVDEKPEHVRKLFALPRISEYVPDDREQMRNLYADWARIAASIARAASATTVDGEWLVARLNNKIKHGMYILLDTEQHRLLLPLRSTPDSVYEQSLTNESAEHFAQQAFQPSCFLAHVLSKICALHFQVEPDAPWKTAILGGEDGETYASVRRIVMA